MVRRAPTFSSLASEVAQRLEGCVFVAHNARFDYGFLKHEFARLERPFRAKVLCTVKLSRRLFPGEASYSLDALIERHALVISERHRALGDARALWQFVQTVYATLPVDGIAATVRRILRIPSLPPQLPPDALDGIPECAGVYLFYGDNPLPLYIGKSTNLRERIAAHFSSDWLSETDLRLSSEMRRIEVQPTAGELGALLREAALIKSLLPAHNRALRGKEDAGVLRFRDDGLPTFITLTHADACEVTSGFGRFSSRRAMRAALDAMAREHALCWRRLGLERRADGPCFSRQLRRCKGACEGAESIEAHDARWHDALRPWTLPRWPFAGCALVREADSEHSRYDVHVVRDWAWLGTARDESELSALLESPPQPLFDLDVTRLLLKTWAKRPSAFVAVTNPA